MIASMPAGTNASKLAGRNDESAGKRAAGGDARADTNTGRCARGRVAQAPARVHSPAGSHPAGQGFEIAGQAGDAAGLTALVRITG